MSIYMSPQFQESETIYICEGNFCHLYSCHILCKHRIANSANVASVLYKAKCCVHDITRLIFSTFLSTLAIIHFCIHRFVYLEPHVNNLTELYQTFLTFSAISNLIILKQILQISAKLALIQLQDILFTCYFIFWYE